MYGKYSLILVDFFLWVNHCYKDVSLVSWGYFYDESIWGGIHLLQNNYLVICLTNGNNQTRAKEFYKVMEQTHNTGIILDYPDKTNGKRDNWKKVYHDIEEDLNYILSNHTFTTIVNSLE